MSENRKCQNSSAWDRILKAPARKSMGNAS